MRLLTALLLSSLAFAAPPTPESVLGHKPGDDFFLASYDESLGYFQKLAASTDKLKLIQVGKTTQGRDWYLAVISSPQNLAQLDKHKDAARRLAWARGLTDATARALAKESKLIVHIDGGLHATEVAHAQHTIQLAYNLVTGADPETANILDNVVLVLWFSINPDGQNMVAHWYKQNLGTPYEVSPMPELYQEYIGHDNNRDGYMNNMLESQVITRTTLDFNPQVVYNHHQTAPFPARIWIPPFAEPISSNVHPLMWRWVNVFGTSMAAYLDEHGMPGAMHRGRFDDWYPGFLDHVNSFRNTVSFLTETALYRYATPHFYTVDEFPKDKQDLRTEMFYSSPWKGGWWRLGDAVRYMLSASMSVLDTAAKHREEILYNRYQAGRDTIQRFEKEPPFAYVIPREQRDVPTAATLVEKMMIAGIEVHQSTEPFHANGMDYKTGTWAIFMNQPFAALVKELFEPQRYPDLRTTPNGPPELPYDVTGWTLPMQMGVETDSITVPVDEKLRARFRKLDRMEPIPGAIEGSGSVVTFSRATNASIRAMNELLAAGATIAIAKSDGAVTASGLDRAKVEPIVARNSLQASAKPAQGATFALKEPRVGLYRPWVGNIDEGWTRWLLEQYKFRFANLRNPDIQAGHLRDRFDAIVIPDVSTRVLTDGFQTGTVPGQYAGGLGETGIEGLREFVSNGGTLITMNGSSQFVIDKLNLPVTNVLAGLKDDQFFCFGSLLKVELTDATHPVVMGLASEPIVVFERGPAFETKAAFKGKVLAKYPKDRNPLMSGYILHPERIQDKAAALDVAYGKGRVVLLGFKPQWRAQSHGAYKFLFNALYYSSAMAPAETTSSRPASPEGDTWRTTSAAIRADIDKLLDQNKEYFAARGSSAVESGKKLETALDQFQKDRIAALDDLRQSTDDRATARKIVEYSAQLKRLASDLRSKDLSASKPADVREQYKLEGLEQDIAAGLAKKP
jgi:zinc carboxypeptidase